jgi:hypothetical protein
MGAWTFGGLPRFDRNVPQAVIDSIESFQNSELAPEWSGGLISADDGDFEYTVAAVPTEPSRDK